MLIHIILGILKIIGILLLVLLCLLLLFLLSLLFSPVRYRAYGYRDSERYEGSVGISWLLHVVHVTGRFASDGDGLKLNIRLFGIPVLTVLEKVQAFQKKRREKAADKSGKKPDLKAAELPESSSGKTVSREETAETPEPSGKSPVEALTPKPRTIEASEEITGRKPGIVKRIFLKIRAFFKKIISLPGKMKKAVSNFWLTAGRICDKIKTVRELLSSEPFLGAKTLVLGELKTVIGHVRPRKVSGRITFGFDDPALTGQVLAAASMFYPLYGRQFSIRPYFDRAILEGEAKISGRMYGVVFLRTVFRLLLNKDIKELRKKIGH